jgi:sulfur carrier protein
MQISVNGTPREVSEDINLLTLLQDLKLNPDTIVVELNRDVVDKRQYDQVTLAPGDVLELVRFVGGGGWL